MGKKVKQIKLKSSVEEEYEALGAQLITYDVVITCLLDALAKIRPAIAKAVAAEIREKVQQIDFEKLGVVRAKAEQYVALIEATLAKNL
jgi:hypothetical protein